MKKVSMVLALVTTTILIGACGVNDKKQSKSSDTSQSETKRETSTTTEETKAKANEDKTSVFTGVLLADAEISDGNDKTIRLDLNEIEAIEDPDDMEKTMKNDGVVLNISADQLVNGLSESDLKKGDKIQFSLNSTPVMTMSLPPQIPGMSIQSVEKID